MFTRGHVFPKPWSLALNSFNLHTLELVVWVLRLRLLSPRSIKTSTAEELAKEKLEAGFSGFSYSATHPFPNQWLPQWEMVLWAQDSESSITRPGQNFQKVPSLSGSPLSLHIFFGFSAAPRNRLASTIWVQVVYLGSEKNNRRTVGKRNSILVIYFSMTNCPRT